MINEETFNTILISNNSNLLIKKNLLFNYSFDKSLNKYILDIFNKFNIPKIRFINCLYYLFKIFNSEKSKNQSLIFNILNNKKLYIFSILLLSMKYEEDMNIDIEYMCLNSNISYSEYIKLEIILLNSLNWNLYIDYNDLINFKKYLENYMDLYHIQD